MALRCGLSCAALLLALAPSSSASGVVQAFPLPNQSTPNGPDGITAGPDGALWFTETGGNRIGRITTSGVISEFPLPFPNSSPVAITTGPDGALWFTERSVMRSAIGRIDSAGQITEFPTPVANSSPLGIASGPDGALWFTENQLDQGQVIGRITPSGQLTEFTTPTPRSGPQGVTVGRDGALWFTEFAARQVGRIDTTGAITEFPLVSGAGFPTEISTGPDGNLWFTDSQGDHVDRITPAGVITRFATPTSGNPWGITSGPDGALWFTELDAGIVGRITTTGRISEYDLGNPDAGAIGIATGPDGGIWVTESRGREQGANHPPSQIVRIDPANPPLPAPVLGRSMNAVLVKGRVLVRAPRSRNFLPLPSGAQISVGAVVDARRGTVRITANSGLGLEAANFYHGEFQIAQSKRKGAEADMRLFGGSFASCPAGLRSPRSISAKDRRSVRHLWGDGSGQFRTIGRFSSAAIRGTTWLTDDRCTGTLTHVTSGSVSVRDFVRRKTVIVKTGHSYFAAARASGRR